MKAVSDKIAKMKTEAEKNRSDPKAHTSYVAKGQLQVIAAIEEDVWNLEKLYDSLVDANDRRDRHSGFGRGDSMG